MLRSTYKIITFTCGYEAIDYFKTGNLCDLILISVTTPEISGFNTLRELKEIERINHIPIMLLTDKKNTQNEIKCLQLGATDYISKPYNFLSLKKRIDRHISLLEYNLSLEMLVKEKEKTIEKLSNVTMTAIASIIGTRDEITNGHMQRTSEYVLAIANELKNSGLYMTELSEENIFMLKKSAPLHDIGKVGIDDAILKKTGKYTPEEFEKMKEHTVIGSEALKKAKLIIGEPCFLDCAEILARHHHEKWDGSGYPDKLKSTKIPLFARIMTVADVYDALVSERTYKPAISHKETVSIMKSCIGTQFDPDICDAFLRINQDFYNISKRFS